MLTRLITGVILAAAVVGLLWWGPNAGVKIFLGLACLIALFEYNAMGNKIFPPESPQPLMGKVALPLVGTCTFVAWILLPAFNILITGLAVLSLGIGHTLGCKDLNNTVQRTGWNILGLFYVSGLLAIAASIVAESGPQSPHRALFLAFLVTVSMGDTMAYFTGRSLGRRALAPTLSPKKTIEGALGGLVGSAAGVTGVSIYFDINPGNLAILVATAIVAGASAQIGDLFESLLKRTAGVKDSGSILPGHGGVLDRIDGILFGAPIFLLYQALTS